MPTAATEAPLASTDRPRIGAIWPLAAAVAFWAAGLALIPQLAPGQEPLQMTVSSVALAVGVLVIGALAFQRIASEPAAAPLAGLTATAATLLALAPLDVAGLRLHIASFVIIAPWRYALPPLLVHFALEIGWPHRRGRWTGWMKGWYAIQAAMLLAGIVGVAMDEHPLIDAIDGTMRGIVLEPAGIVAALIVTGLALADSQRVRRVRAALWWTAMGIAAGAGPFVVSDLIPGIDPSTAAIARMALTILPVCATLAILALPLRDPAERDHVSYRLAAALVETTDIDAVVAQIAATLQQTLDAQRVLVRVAQPAARAAIGDISAWETAPLAAADFDDPHDGSELALPIGRRQSPLGDVRLGAGHAGAFGAAEQEWISAFLRPIAGALRARQREVAAIARLQNMLAAVSRSVADLVEAADQLPPGPSDAGLAVPPPVDAREVLGQLSDGVSGIVQHGEGLLELARDARERARAASDAVARSLDRLASVATQVNQLTQQGDDIAANNATVSGVAFRTNLVANNASLEADRAGTAGRAFGVLAEEVRRLADTAAITSQAIGTHTTTFAAAAVDIAASLDMARAGLAQAIRDAEAAEHAAQRLSEAASQLEDVTHSLNPAVTEANAVAKRRSTRDRHLTETLDRFLAERSALHHALVAHRDAMQRLASKLTTLDPASAPPP